MAKISDLVKTYRMLSDPNAPDWNVKFVGAIAVGALLVAAGTGAVWWAMSDETPDAAGTSVASTQDEPAACPTAADGTPIPTVSPECAEAAPDVLP